MATWIGGVDEVRSRDPDAHDEALAHEPRVLHGLERSQALPALGTLDEAIGSVYSFFFFFFAAAAAAIVSEDRAPALRRQTIVAYAPEREPGCVRGYWPCRPRARDARPRAQLR